ncbi:MAG: integrase core domain-containing protein [candidate division WOR-3 bacterium]
MATKLENKIVKLSQVFTLVEQGSISLKDAAFLTGYSYWHLTRLYHRAQGVRLEQLFQPKPPPRKLSQANVALLKNYYDKLKHPQISLLAHFLYQDHPTFPRVSEEWLRRVLIREQVYSPPSRGRVFRHRFEAPAPGVLVQGDSTPFPWIPGDDTYYHLIAFIDDCTRLCLGMALAEHDSVVEHFQLLKSIIRHYGRFIALYYDNDEKYRYIRHNQSRHYTYHTDQADLQVIRALSELGIQVINTKPYDPCGKGKIERFLETCQLQLPIWFQHYRVRNLQEAREYLMGYRAYYNRQRRHRELGMTPQQKFDLLRSQNRFAPVKTGLDLRRIFAFRYFRKVASDNTISFEGTDYQLERQPFAYSYYGKTAEIRYLPGRFLTIYIDDKPVNYRQLLTVSRRRSE